MNNPTTGSWNPSSPVLNGRGVVSMARLKNQFARSTCAV